MKDTPLDTAQRSEIQRELEPYLRITGISESKHALFFHGRWRYEGADRHAEDTLRTHDGELGFKVDHHQDQAMVRVTHAGYAGDRPRYWLHALLFLLTIVTTLGAGALMEGRVPWTNPGNLVYGIPFSVTLLLILGTHELGHYLAARYHKVEATLPYFIPAPTFIGTFGAFIKMKSPIVSKRALLEIGAAGPIAGFIMTIPALLLGLHMSTVVNTTSTAGGLRLGDSIFMWLATHAMFPHMGPGQDVMLSSVAFAAWIGLLVTALNLLPIGQLDGGHIAYAMFGKKHTWIARIAFFALIPLSFLSLNWLIWAALIFFLIRIQHPPILESYEPLTTFQRAIGWVSMFIFIGTFIPQPFIL
ncbi:MAG: site-2 protease family protein [Calditrichota bacterium]